MKYLFLLKIKIEKFPQYFIEVAQSIELKVHPNLSDEIWIDMYFCKINKILHDIDNEKIHIEIEAYDGMPTVKEESEVVKRLKEEVKELKSIGWYINDYDLGEKVTFYSQTDI